jgi:hypothetical protein
MSLDLEANSAESDIEIGLLVRSRIRLVGFLGGAVLCALVFVITDEHMPLAQTLLPALLFAALPGAIAGLVLAEIGRTLFPNQWRLRRALLARRATATWLTNVGTTVKFVLVLGIPALMLTVAIPVYQHKNLRARVAYAWEQTANLRTAVENFYREHHQLPTSADALGTTGHRTDYPDGGYFRLESNGRIRITFTVKPALRSGTIVQSPTFEESKLRWACTIEGSIKRQYLPVSCRE